MSSRARTVTQFAAAYGAAALIAATAWLVFGRNPPPRFGDLILPGVALLSTRRSWQAAACLLAVSVGIMLVVVPPVNQRMLLGFGILTATGAMIVWVVELAKRRKPEPPESRKA
jgi:hypothetical protein